jgi:hypothetical protein
MNSYVKRVRPARGLRSVEKSRADRIVVCAPADESTSPDRERPLPALAQRALRISYAQALVETVIGIQGLVKSKEWTQTDIDAALSEQALTATVMQRYHVHFAVKRQLGSNWAPVERV